MNGTRGNANMPTLEEQIRAQSEREINDWIRFGMRLGVSAALHPFDYSKTLIQIGYEPIPARLGKSILGKPIMQLPNIFQYTGHIRKIDGLAGCYRGLVPKLVGSVISMVVSEKVADRLGLSPTDGDKNESELTNNELYIQYKQNLKRDVVLSISGIIASHPFHVISLRMMAQFVGRETLYNSTLGSIAEIYKTEGIIGFFAGLVPKVLCDLVCLVLTSTTVYLVNKYVILDKMGRQYNAGLVQFAVSSALYPMQVVSTCSAVSGSRLMAAHEPIMPYYPTWIHCFRDLRYRGELKRGSSLFWRSQSTPMDIHNYVPMPRLNRY